jgi:DNA (cytosine-5)-methyltransferase 1
VTSRENRSSARPDSAHLHARGRPPSIALGVAVRGRDGGQSIELGNDKSNALRSAGGGASRALAFHTLQDPISGDVSMPLDHKQAGMGVAREGLVRRLTPRECERLQDFPDDYTLVKLSKKQRSKVDAEMVAYHMRQGHTEAEALDFVRNAPDGPRYQALGNSMAVCVMRWLGKRINAVEQQLRRA